MAKSKGVRIVVTLECRTAEGVYRYTTTKIVEILQIRWNLKSTVLYPKNMKFLKK